MEGTLYIELDSNCIPCNIWEPRYFVNFPFSGLKYLTTISDERNRYLKRNDCLGFATSLSLIRKKKSGTGNRNSSSDSGYYGIDQDGTHTGWIFGGSLILESIKTDSVVIGNVRGMASVTEEGGVEPFTTEMQLYPIVINLKCNHASIIVRLAALSEQDRVLWMAELKIEEARQAFVSSCLDSRITPSASLFAGLIDCQSEIFVNDIDFKESCNHIHCIMTFIHIRCPFGLLLQTINFNNCNLTDDALLQIAGLLHETPHLTNLSLTNSKHPISATGIKYIADFLPLYNQELISINLSGNFIDDTGLSYLCTGLSGCHKLKFLNLSRNNLSPDSVLWLSSHIASYQMKCLSHFNLSHNNFGDSLVDFISSVSNCCPAAEYIDITYCKLASSGLTRMAQVPLPPSLRFLDVSGIQSVDNLALMNIFKAIFNHRSKYAFNKTQNHAKSLDDAKYKTSVLTFFGCCSKDRGSRNFSSRLLYKNATRLVVNFGGIAPTNSYMHSFCALDNRMLKLAQPYFPDRGRVTKALLRRRVVWFNGYDFYVRADCKSLNGQPISSISSPNKAKLVDKDHAFHGAEIDDPNVAQKLSLIGGATKVQILDAHVNDANVNDDGLKSRGNRSSVYISQRRSSHAVEIVRIALTNKEKSEQSDIDLRVKIESFIACEAYLPPFVDTPMELLELLAMDIGVDIRQLYLITVIALDPISRYASFLFSFRDIDESYYLTSDRHNLRVSREFAQMPPSVLSDILINNSKITEAINTHKTVAFLNEYLQELCKSSEMAIRRLGVSSVSMYKMTKETVEDHPVVWRFKYDIEGSVFPPGVTSDMISDVYPVTLSNSSDVKYDSGITTDDDEKVCISTQFDDVPLGDKPSTKANNQAVAIINDVLDVVNQKRGGDEGKNAPPLPANAEISQVSLIRRERLQQFMENRDKIVMREENELLIFAIRKLYKNGEITSSIAKFWEGAFGNEKFMKNYHIGMTQVYDSKISEKHFKASAIRDNLFNALSARDVTKMYEHLGSFKKLGFNDDLDFGSVITLASRLLSEILSLQRDAQAILLGGIVVSNLFVIDQLLMRFAATGYSGEEVSLILQYKQKLIKKMSQEQPGEFKEIINIIKYRSRICNLMMSRDFEGLAECISEINFLGISDHANDVTKSEEFAMAIRLRKEGAALNSLTEALLDEKCTDINKMEDAVAWMCYRNFPSLPLAKLKKKILNMCVDVEGKLMAPLLNAMRKSDNTMVERCIMMCYRAGWRHEAFRGNNITAILESKETVLEDESVKSRLTKSALSILNGIESSLRVSDVLYLLRKVASMDLKKDPHFQKYINVCTKFVSKNRNEAALDGAIQKIIDEKNVDQLMTLLAGRGTRRMVLSASSANEMEEWINNIEDVCKGKYTALIVQRADYDESVNKNVNIRDGTMEKAPTSASSRKSLKGWKKRYFTLNGSHLKYYSSSVSNEALGDFYLLGGTVSKLSQVEANNKPYCFEVFEGRDLSHIDSNQLDEAKKVISKSRSKMLVKIITHAIQQRDEETIRQGLQDARDLNFFLDYDLYRAAKYCLVQIAMSDLEKQLEWILVDIPSEKLLPLKNMCLSLNFDYKNALFISLNRLLSCSDTEFSIIRLANAMMINHEARFVKFFHRLSRMDINLFTPSESVSLASVIILHAGRRAYRSYLDGDSFKNILKILTMALACANSLSVETEGMHLARLMVSYFAKLHAVSQKDRIAGLGFNNEVDLDAIEAHASKTNLVISVANYLDIIKAEIGINTKLTLDKYPHLRTKASMKSSFLDVFQVFNKKKEPVGKKGENRIVAQFLSYSPDRMRSSLLVLKDEEELAAIEIFDAIRVISSFDNKNCSKLRTNKKNLFFKKSLSTIPDVFNEMIPQLTRNPLLIDELFIQITKQVTNNPDYHMRKRLWITFALFIQLVRPSSDLSPFLKNYMYTAAGLESYQMTKYDDLRKRSSRLSHDKIRNQILELTELKTSVLAFTVPTNRALTPAELKLMQMRAEMVPEMEVVQDILVLIAYNLRVSMTYDESSFTGQGLKSSANKMLEKKKKAISVKYTTFLPPRLITRVISSKIFNVDIVLMTGSVYRFPVRFGEIPSLYTFLPMLYERMMGGCDILRSIAIEKGMFKPGMSSTAWMDFAISIFRGFCFYYSDDLDILDKNTLKLADIPTQSSIASHVPWNSDIVWKILENKDIEDAKREKKIKKKGLFKDTEEIVFEEGPDPSDPNAPADITILFRKQATSSAEKFEDMNKIFKENISDCDILRNQTKWREWLKDDFAEIPLDHIKIDLMFAEETRYVNTRLYPCTDDVFSYLVGLQIALERWIDFGNPDKDPKVWGSDHCHKVLDDSITSVRPIYMVNPQETKKLTRRHHLRKMAREEQGSEYESDQDYEADHDDTDTASIYSKSTIFSYNVFNKSAHHSYLNEKKHHAAAEKAHHHHHHHHHHQQQRNQRDAIDIAAMSTADTAKKNNVNEHNYFHREMARVDARNKKKRQVSDNANDIQSHFDDEFTVLDDDDDDNDDIDSHDGDRSAAESKSQVGGGRPIQNNEDDNFSISSKGDSDSDYVDEFHAMVGGKDDDFIGEGLSDDDGISDTSSLKDDEDGDDAMKNGGKKSRRTSAASVKSFEDPTISSSIDNIREGDMILIRNKLLALGLDYDINSPMIKLVAHWLLLFHRIASGERVSVESHNYRYLIKRAYLEYLSGCPFYGHTFSQAILLNAGNGEVVDVIVTASPTGINLLDQNTWETIYTAPLWDIDSVSVSNPNDHENESESKSKAGSATGSKSAGTKPYADSEEGSSSSLCLLLTINDQTLVLKSDYANDIQELLQRCILEALSQGIFPRGKDFASIFSTSYSKFLNHILPTTSALAAGSSAELDLHGKPSGKVEIVNSNSIYNYHDIYLPGIEFSIHHFEAYQEFLHSCTLLPIPPIICSMKFNTTNRMIYRGVNARQLRFHEEMKRKIESEEHLNNLATKRMQDLEDNLEDLDGGSLSGTPTGSPGKGGMRDGSRESPEASNNVPFAATAAASTKPKKENIDDKAEKEEEKEKEKLKTLRLIIEYSTCGQSMPNKDSNQKMSSRSTFSLPNFPRRIRGHWVQHRSGGPDSKQQKASPIVRQNSLNSAIHKLSPVDSFDRLFVSSKKIELPNLSFFIDSDFQSGANMSDSDKSTLSSPPFAGSKPAPIATDISDYYESHAVQASRHHAPATELSGIDDAINDGAAKMGIVLPIFEPEVKVKRPTVGYLRQDNPYDSLSSGVVRGRCLLLTQYLKEKEKEKEKRGSSSSSVAGAAL